MTHQQHPFSMQNHQECSEEAKASSHLEPASPGRKRRSKEERRERRAGEQRAEGQNFGHWSLEENKRYHWFLEMHSQHFLNRHLRRMDKIFKSMALFVATREAEQCRSHHQKMEKKYSHSFALILMHLRQEHYHTHATLPLAEEIAEHQLPLRHELLSQHFLRGCSGQQDHQESEMMELLPEEAKIDQQAKGYYGSQLSLIDSLFEMDAPHNDYSLI